MPEYFQPGGPGDIGSLSVPDGITPLTDAAQRMLAEDGWQQPGAKLERALTLAAMGTAKVQGLLTLADQRRDEFRDAKSGPDILAALAAKAGRDVTDEESAKADDAIERTKRAFNAVSAALTAGTDVSFGGRTVANTCVALVNACAKGNYDISVVKVTALPGPIANVSAEGKAADDAEFAEIRAIKAAPGRQESVVATIIQDLDAQIAKPGFSLSFGPGRPRFHLAQALLPVETTGGEMTTIDHLAPLVLAANRDTLVAEITARVDEHYRHVRLELSDPEKAERIASIEEQMLARHRREAETIWAALERGEDVYFRKGLSPAAVLGIEGGPTVKLRGHEVLDD